MGLRVLVQGLVFKAAFEGLRSRLNQRVPTLSDYSTPWVGVPSTTIV